MKEELEQEKREQTEKQGETMQEEKENKKKELKWTSKQELVAAKVADKHRHVACE